MASSQKEFIVGCLLGGLVGVSAALLLPRRYIDKIDGTQTKFVNHHPRVHSTRTGTVQKTHSSPLSYKKTTKVKKTTRPIKD